MLHEYCQRMKVEPEYFDTQDERSGEFTSVVTILDKTFESMGSLTAKNIAKKMAAKEAMKYFNRLPRYSTCSMIFINFLQFCCSFLVQFSCTIKC